MPTRATLLRAIGPVDAPSKAADAEAPPTSVTATTAAERAAWVSAQIENTKSRSQPDSFR
ncbi:hypothetical protein I553_5839 [Mycobacterium xenopi 4042]|uniref:Uncharacterized protein n=1 Tax=Mycobacterium xenopi 4042 TaxID=1299334 RepID=X7ZVS0_MYCXE|nr:hypothetical protein I553_5839 [Mycobacterium xenopi 4042]